MTMSSSGAATASATTRGSFPGLNQGLQGQFYNGTAVGNPVLADADIGSQNGSMSFDGQIWTVTGSGSGIGNTLRPVQFCQPGFCRQRRDRRRALLAFQFRRPSRPHVPQRRRHQIGLRRRLPPRQCTPLSDAHRRRLGLRQRAGALADGPVWIKLSRNGDLISASYCLDGLDLESDRLADGGGRGGSSRPAWRCPPAMTPRPPMPRSARRRSATSRLTTRAILSFFADYDIGSPGRSGSSAYSTGDSYLVSGGGSGIGIEGQADDFHFSSQEFYPATDRSSPGIPPPPH